MREHLVDLLPELLRRRVVALSPGRVGELREQGRDTRRVLHLEKHGERVGNTTYMECKKTL